jgi:hypothetical protein
MPLPMFNATNFPRDMGEALNFTGDQRSASTEDGEYTQNRLNYYHTLKNAFDKQVVPQSPEFGSGLLDEDGYRVLQQVAPFHAFVREGDMTVGQMAESIGSSSAALAAFFSDINPEGIEASDNDELLGVYLATGGFGPNHPVVQLERPELMPDRVPVRQEDLDERSTPVDVSYFGSENNVDKLNNPSPEESQRLQSMRLYNLMMADNSEDASGNLGQITRLGAAGVHGAMGMAGQISGGLKPSIQMMRDYRLLQEPDGHLAFHGQYYRRGEPGQNGEMPLIRGQDGIPNYVSEMATSATGLSNVAEGDPQRGMSGIMKSGQPMRKRLTDMIMTGDMFGGDIAKADQALLTGGYVVPDNVQEGKEQEFYDLSKKAEESEGKAYDYIGAAAKNLDNQIGDATGFYGVGDTTGYPSAVSTGLGNLPADFAGADRTIALTAPLATGGQLLRTGVKGGAAANIRNLAKGMGKGMFEEASEQLYYTPALIGGATGNPLDALRRQETNDFMGDVSSEDYDYGRKFHEKGVDFALDREKMMKEYKDLLKK